MQTILLHCQVLNYGNHFDTVHSSQLSRKSMICNFLVKIGPISKPSKKIQPPEGANSPFYRYRKLNQMQTNFAEKRQNLYMK